jgi:hypothetical protein
VLNALAGHFNSFGATAPIPKKRLERIVKVVAYSVSSMVTAGTKLYGPLCRKLMMLRGSCHVAVDYQVTMLSAQEQHLLVCEEPDALAHLQRCMLQTALLFTSFATILKRRVLRECAGSWKRSPLCSQQLNLIFCCSILGRCSVNI